MRCKSVEKYICIIYIKMNLQNFRLLPKRSKQQASKYKKNGLYWACGTSKTKIKSMNITSNTNCPDNGTRKLVGEVVPPQSVAGEGSSSA